MTQECWAELLGISVEAVGLYETGRNMPSDGVVLKMAMASGDKRLVHCHLLRKSSCAQRILPAVKTRTLPEAVLNLIVQIEEFKRTGLEDLKRLAIDGKISENEVLGYGEAMQELKDVVTAAYELEYADTE